VTVSRDSNKKHGWVLAISDLTFIIIVYEIANVPIYSMDGVACTNYRTPMLLVVEFPWWRGMDEMTSCT